MSECVQLSFEIAFLFYSYASHYLEGLKPAVLLSAFGT